MRKAGEVVYADAHKLYPNEGIVEFASYSEVKRAVEKFDGYELNGRKLEVVDDSDKRRSRSRSDDRRSHSGSRHHSRKRKSSRDSHSRSGSHDRSRKPRDNSESPYRGNEKQRAKSFSGSPARRDQNDEKNGTNERSRSPSEKRAKNVGGRSDDEYSD